MGVVQVRGISSFALFCMCSGVEGQGVLVTGFGSHIEGASISATGQLYATHFRDIADDSFNGNSQGRNKIGQVVVESGEISLFFEGELGASFNGMRWDADGKHLFLADVGQNKVVKVDLDSMEGVDYCGGGGSAMDGKGAPNDIALSRSGVLFLSGQDWGSSTGGLWACRPVVSWCSSKLAWGARMASPSAPTTRRSTSPRRAAPLSATRATTRGSAFGSTPWMQMEASAGRRPFSISPRTWLPPRRRLIPMACAQTWMATCM